MRRGRNSSGRRSPARKDPLFRRFEGTLGREEVLDALMGSGSERAVRLAAMLCDPAYRHHTLGRLCERVGLGYLDLFDIYRRAKLGEALFRMCLHLPDVMEDVAIDAKAHERACLRRGARVIRSPGDAAARRLVFKITGLTGKRRSPGQAGA